VTTLVGILGWPVEHSRSPAMHNAAFEAAGLDWRYELLPVEPEHFADLVRQLPGRGFAGANVTIPHKLRALELADDPSEVAQAVGAANTLIFKDGRIAADNTDVGGVLSAIAERAPGAPAGMEALVLGAGGAARAAAYALATAGAGSVGVWNRHPQRAQRLVAELNAALEDPILHTVADPGSDRAPLLVNATSVGMDRGSEAAKSPDFDFKELCLSADEMGDRQIVVDLVYRSGGTWLVRTARDAGLATVDGIDVLVHQGIASFRLWTGREPSLEAMRSGAGDGTHNPGSRRS
jgi:shikimate dehydrogenase